jgi:UMF1 family MFS transporter
MLISFIIVGAWWFITTIPLLKNYKQLHFVEREQHPVKKSFQSLAKAFKDMKQDKKIMLFLIAYFFYIDGVYTIIEMATSYGKTLGLDSTGLLLALLVTQFVAFPCALIMGKLSVKIASEKLIATFILAYTGIAVFAFFMTTQLHFWILAILVGVFQGGIQALSRSYFAKIIPESKSCEYFGIMDICGKGASFLGTTLVSIVSQLTGNANLGVGVLTFLFLIGLILFIRSAFPDKTITTLFIKKENMDVSSFNN